MPETARRRIHYTGPLDWPQIARLRDSHPIALIASRYEVFGYTMLEAMAAGQAIVSTDVGGPAEVLEQERTALLVPAGDAGAMAGALAQLIGDPAQRQALAAAAYDRLMRDFSPEAVAERTVAFVHEILSR
jgi:glycosyltransferase involved in cell wall biosynthesis